MQMELIDKRIKDFVSQRDEKLTMSELMILDEFIAFLDSYADKTGQAVDTDNVHHSVGG